jgi:hypothetical protein
MCPKIKKVTTLVRGVTSILAQERSYFISQALLLLLLPRLQLDAVELFA